MLAHHETEAIAALKDNFGFQLLLESIQAEIDTMGDQMELLTTEGAAKILPRWQSMRVILKVLKSRPHEMAAQLERRDDEEADPQEFPIKGPLPNPYEALLRKLQAPIPDPAVEL